MRLLFAVVVLCFASGISAVRAAPPAAVTKAQRDRAQQKLIDDKLVAAFLKKRRVKADPEALEQNLRFVLNKIRKAGKKPEEVLRKTGRTVKSLKAELALNLACMHRHFGKVDGH